MYGFPNQFTDILCYSVTTPAQHRKNLKKCTRIQTSTPLAADTKSEGSNIPIDSDDDFHRNSLFQDNNDDIPIAHHPPSPEDTYCSSLLPAPKIIPCHGKSAIDDIPIASDEDLDPVHRSPPPLPLSDLLPPSPENTHHNGILPAPEITLQQGKSAVECMVTMATLVGQWNIKLGPVADWPHQFTNKYVSAVGEKTTVAFIGGIAQKVQSGRVLMDDIACVTS